jgi:hypothetical protein
MFRKKSNWLLTALAASLLMASCGEDNLPPISTDIIRNANEANLFIESVYNEMVLRSLFLDAFVMMPLLFSDNCLYAGISNDSWQAASDMEIDPDDDTNWGMFTDFYSINEDLNVLFAQLDTTEHETLTDDVKDGFRAEGRAIRAMLYYYLSNYWGGVPLIDETTDQSDTNLMNATPQELYDFIESDLLFADENITKSDYADNSRRLGEAAVKGWLARFYLQNGEWSEALNYAEATIQVGTAVLEEDYGNIFDRNSLEHLWIVTETLGSISLASYFLQPFSNGLYVVRPRAVAEFEEGDRRREIALSVPGTTIIKYKDISDNSDPAYMFRLAEVHLIAAEAAARMGQFNTASGHINVIRFRAGLDDIELEAENYKQLILKERNAELSYEGFHRLLDLRRFGVAEDFLEEYGYDEKDALWPIPNRILEDFSSLEQNPGYE